MKDRITKGETKAFRERWRAVNNAELAELKATPVAKKFRQLAALLISAKQLGWTRALKAEEAEVRKRWSRLRKASIV